jgi:PAS domain S-box-containing protein
MPASSILMRERGHRATFDLRGLPEAMFPASVLNYVSRSRDRVLLDDAASPNANSADDYFSRQRPKSVLCFPIVKQTQLLGVLYLENELATHAFTPDRLAVLELLAAQAAISLENALVYDALRESEAKYRRIIDTASEGIWLLGPDLMTTFVNARMAEMLGYSPDEIIGRPSTDFMFAEDVPDHLKRMENRRKGLSERYERRFRRRGDGAQAQAPACGAGAGRRVARRRTACGERRPRHAPRGVR